MAIDRVAGAQRRLDVATGELAKAIRNGETGVILQNRERNVVEAAHAKRR